MIVRRVLFGACALLFVTAAPASADHTYSHVLGEGGERTPGVSTGGQGVSAAGQGGATSAGASSGTSGSDSSSTTGNGAGGLLARTGSDSLVPMAEGAAVLIGAGALLVLATRRRRSTSTSTSTASA